VRTYRIVIMRKAAKRPSDDLEQYITPEVEKVNESEHCTGGELRHARVLNVTRIPAETLGTLQGAPEGPRRSTKGGTLMREEEGRNP
jgi:hypothetical protein